MSRAAPIACPFCSSRHMPKFLCDEAAALLAKLREKTEANKAPGAALDGVQDVLLTQFVVSSAVLPAQDAMLPALVFSGRDQHGRSLPRWMYVASVDQLDQAKAHFVEQADDAIARARAGVVPEPV